ncbi:hypothetical protein [Clostridium tertium]|uniref:hypothetical protein n=1 Tax=Clostridium tertium TaxID=1559 RepID=UPI0023B23889|nr:hypothetical protein [Clostridium tertium]
MSKAITVKNILLENEIESSIKLNGETLTCHRCGGKCLSIINVNYTEPNKLVVWCNSCDEETLEDVLDLDKIKRCDFYTKF